MKHNSLILLITLIIMLVISAVAVTFLIIGTVQLDVVDLFNTFPAIQFILIITTVIIVSTFIFYGISIYRRHIREKQVREELDDVRIDSLTQMFNFKYFIKLLQRMDNPFTLALMDVDNFKEINDKFGSVIGDLVLKVIAKSIKANLRYNDIVARYEGDAFLIILDNCPPKCSIDLLETIRHKIKNNDMLAEKNINLSTSVGMHFVTKAEPIETLLRKTVKALSIAKGEKDKKVIIYNEEDKN